VKITVTIDDDLAAEVVQASDDEATAAGHLSDADSRASRSEVAPTTCADSKARNFYTRRFFSTIPPRLASNPSGE
jgi:hypothetical protein